MIYGLTSFELTSTSKKSESSVKKNNCDLKLLIYRGLICIIIEPLLFISVSSMYPTEL